MPDYLEQRFHPRRPARYSASHSVLRVMLLPLLAGMPTAPATAKITPHGAARPVTTPPQKSAADYAIETQSLNCDNVARQPDLKPLAAVVMRAILNAPIADPPQGEFESTAQAERRHEEYWNKALGGATQIIALPPSDEHYSHYDADRQRLMISALLMPDIKGSDFRSYLWTLQESEPRRRSYRAQNAYGTSVIVDSDTIDCISLSVTPAQTESVDLQGIHRDVPISMSPEDARLFEQSGSIIYVAEPLPPFVTTTIDHMMPTIDAPYERTENQTNLSVRLRCVILAVGDREVGRLTFP